MVLEYCPRGNLEDALCRIGDKSYKVFNTCVPDGILWNMFDCLFRIVLALEFPVRYWSDFDEKGPEVFEEIPPNAEGVAPTHPPVPPVPKGKGATKGAKGGKAATAAKTAKRPILRPKAPSKKAAVAAAAGDDQDIKMPDDEDDNSGGGSSKGGPRTYDVDESSKKCIIHFDIDPQNIFVDYFGDEKNEIKPKHAITPILKIADFGLSGDAVDLAKGDIASLWLSRMRGKTPFFTPEQFTKEWFHLTGAKKTFGNPTIAAQYSWKSNLFQLATVLLMFITLRDVPPIPIARDIDRALVGITETAAAEKKARVGQSSKTKAAADLKFWTYGHVLVTGQHPNKDIVDFDTVDLKLRQLVARCMADDPADRPGLVELRDAIQDGLARTNGQASAETKREWRAWSEAVFGALPAAIVPRSRETYDAWLAGKIQYPDKWGPIKDRQQRFDPAKWRTVP